MNRPYRTRQVRRYCLLKMLMPSQHHPSGNDSCREGGLQSRESFDDEHPGIHVIVLGLPVGEQAVPENKAVLRGEKYRTSAGAGGGWEQIRNKGEKHRRQT